jgi:hypothetical protein
MWHDVLLMHRLVRLLCVLAALAALWAGTKWLAAQPRFAIRQVQVESHDGKPLGRWRCRKFAALF